MSNFKKSLSGQGDIYNDIIIYNWKSQHMKVY